MTARHEYALDLARYVALAPAAAAKSFQLRPARRADASALAELMIDAYRGTIDYDDETLEDAVKEVQSYLAEERGEAPQLDLSRLAFAEERLAAAFLIATWHERGRPIIAYVMTAAQWKKQGLGRLVVSACLNAMKEHGDSDVGAVITAGNVPSERLFAGLGFRRVKRL